MRLRELKLVAFGHFAGETLDFAAGGPALHVIYGRNEAGKSTALRAVKGLLFGIRPKSRDAHLHRQGELRVGAALEGPGGELLRVVRRPGRLHTLFDEAGAELDPARIERLLGGVSEELFGTMFGLDHEVLRAGGEALLAGRGHLGESLLEAGLGGVGLHAALERLREEADAIFTAQARTRPLNEALKAHAEAKRRVAESAMPPRAWLEQQAELGAARSARARAEEDARAAEVARRRAQRLRRALPLRARVVELEARRAELGAVVLLDETAGRVREREARERDQAARAAARLDEERAELAARRDGLVVPEPLLAEEAAIEALRERRGADAKAKLDLPRVRGELERLREQATQVAARIGAGAPRDAAGARIDAAAQARVRRLALDRAAVDGELRAAAREEEAATAQADERRARHRALAEPAPRAAIEALEAAAARAQRQGGFAERLARFDEARSRLATMGEARLAALGLWSGPLAALAALAVPLEETVARFERTWEELGRRRAAADERARALAARIEELAGERAAIERGGAVPTEQELLEARARRDQAFKLVRRALSGAAVDEEARALDPEQPLADAYAERSRAADEAADRLRREAERVARRERLEAHAAAARTEEEALEREQRAHGEREAAAQAEWQKEWRAAGIVPLDPAEMRGWRARHGALVQLAEQIGATESDRAALLEQAEAQRRQLVEALAAVGRPGEGTIDELADRAARAADEARALERSRAEAQAGLEEAERAVRRAGEARRRRSEELDGWRAAWAAALAPLGLDGAAAPEEATAVLDARVELAQKLDEVERTRQRVQGMERDARRFADEAQRLCARCAPDLLEQPPDAAAAQLARRLERARADAAERERIDSELEERARRADEERARRAQAEAQLAALRAAARLGDGDGDEALERAEQRSARARELDREIADAEERLRAAAEGAPLDGLAEELAGQTGDALAAEEERLSARLEELLEERRGHDQTIGRLERGLELLEGTSSAEAAAAEAAQHLARARALAERYLVVRAAHHLLSREVERYREANQGPLVQRASALFARLTLRAWHGLQVGFDEQDQAVLRCVRADGREVDVGGLSDGTRDQLYLALRLATLERQAGPDSPPLVVDDLLIHFDDPRARAGLEVLGELAERMQVLFFTHHARLVDLAREAVPPERLHEHRLGEGAPDEAAPGNPAAP